MYLEVIKNGDVFVFFEVVGVFYLKHSGKLVVETPGNSHEFGGMDDRLWGALDKYLSPSMKVGINLDKKIVYPIGWEDWEYEE